ncbi:MAG: hypothetical protein ACP6IP_06775 [Candidatus Njordarchaeia archaeon]
MGEKVTSVRINEDLWKRAKLLAVIKGKTLKSILESAIVTLVEGEEIARLFNLQVNNRVLNELKKLRKEGKLPFEIVSEKTAVELVKEGRGA